MQAAQGGRHPGKNLYPRGIRAIVRFFDERAVAIEEHRAPAAHMTASAARNSVGVTVAVPPSPTTMPLATLANSAA